MATACAITPTVVPTIGKTFSPATIDPGQTSLLMITLSNSDATAASLTAPFTDTLPTGVLIAGTPRTTCGGTATATGTSVTLTGGSVAAIGSCTLSVLVTAASGGSYINTIAAGVLQTSNGSNALPAIATLTVLQVSIAPTLGKAFSPSTIAAGGTSLLTITLSNAEGTAATMAAPLTDTLPAGVLIAGTPATTCGGTGDREYLVGDVGRWLDSRQRFLYDHGARNGSQRRQLHQLDRSRCLADQQWQQRCARGRHADRSADCDPADARQGLQPVHDRRG